MKMRNVTMTVYAIEAQQFDVTRFPDWPETSYMNGYVTIKAHGGGDEHSWRHREGERHYWPGDTVVVTLVEDGTNESDGGRRTTDDLPNPVKDKRK